MRTRFLKQNVGPFDRAVRAVLGLGLVAMALLGMTPWGWLGLVPLATALVGSCPIYTVAGVSTRRARQPS